MVDTSVVKEVVQMHLIIKQIEVADFPEKVKIFTGDTLLCEEKFTGSEVNLNLPEVRAPLVLQVCADDIEERRKRWLTLFMMWLSLLTNTNGNIFQFLLIKEIVIPVDIEEVMLEYTPISSTMKIKNGASSSFRTYILADTFRFWNLTFYLPLCLLYSTVLIFLLLAFRNNVVLLIGVSFLFAGLGIYEWIQWLQLRKSVRG